MAITRRQKVQDVNNVPSKPKCVIESSPERIIVNKKSESDKEIPSLSSCCIKSLKELEEDHGIFQFFRDTSIHGLTYVGQFDRKTFERLLWLLIVLSSLGMAVYLIQDGVIGPFFGNPIMISFDSAETTVDQIPFPAFTLCNANKVRRSPLEELEHNITKYYELEAIRKKNNYSESTSPKYVPNNEYLTLQYLDRYCEGSKSFLNSFGYADFGKIPYRLDNDDPLQNTLINSHVSNKLYREEIWPRLKDSFHRCGSTVLLCLWQKKPVPCEELFFPIQTEFGYCCTFNMMPQFILRRLQQNDSRVRGREQRLDESIVKEWNKFNMDKDLVWMEPEDDTETEDTETEDTKDKNIPQPEDYPRYQETAGANNGLSILVNPELNEYHCMAQNSIGFKANVHSLVEAPHVADFGKAVNPNSETFISVRAEITTADKDLISIDKRKRQCYFLDEYNLTTSKIYSERNCLDECIANITFEKCKCVRYFMPIQENQTICVPNSYDCAKDVKTNVSKRGVKESCKMCLPSCTEVVYHSNSRYLPLRKDVNMWKSFSTDLDEQQWANDNLSIIHVYFETNTVKRKTRKALYGLEEILGNGGGLLGLALGFSLISLVEPIYFLTLRYFFNNLREKNKKTVNSKGIASKSNFKAVATSSAMESQKQPMKPYTRRIVVKPSSDIERENDFIPKDMRNQRRF